LGADAYFVKPFDFDVLVGRLLAMMGDAASPAAHASQRLWEARAAQALHEMAVPPHIKGYRYLLSAIVMVLNAGGVVRDMTGIIYPAIAEKYAATPARVERMMRHAVECAWNRSSARRIEQVFGYTVDMEKSKPSNSEFIAMLADRILLGRPAAKQ
ncbi:MAG: sporulation initiation factor Spo0A C-terminal domain-containing protein, partial [Eubacteriales bacterium]|nr:sporulation initiation factor Spo0A C-terminal domain-containing protein [Eubacteriales bacterium]